MSQTFDRLAQGGLLRSAPPPPEVLEEYRTLIGDRLIREIELVAAEHHDRVGGLAAHLRPEITEPGRALGEVATAEFQQRIREHRKSLDLGFNRQFMVSVDLHSGLEILAPPYDIDWTSGVLALADRNKGAMQISPFATVNGRAVLASAVGVFLTPSENVFVRFAAQALLHYDWGYVFWNHGGHATSEGGAGVLVYETASGDIIKDVRSRLWIDGRWMASLDAGGSGDDLSLSSTSAGQVYFPMTAGRTYLVWVWLWSTTFASGEALSTSNIQARIPFMVVDPGPQPVVK